MPETLKAGCAGRIVEAHTVSRSSCLKRIAREGHVYKVMPTMGTLVKHNGRPEPQLIGINKASTFTGFCAEHDRVLFSPIENRPFLGTKEQLFLLAYRAVCREWYNKIAAAKNIDLYRTLDRGHSFPEQRQLQKVLSAYALGTSAGLKNINAHKSVFDQVLVSKDFGPIRSLFIAFDRQPAVMGSGGLFPGLDFAGAQLQDLRDLETVPDVVLFSSFASEDKGYFCLIWHSDFGHTSEILARSLETINNDGKADATMRFMFEFCENLYLAPDWREARSTAEKEALVNRIRQGSPFVGRRRTCLLDDGLRMADWKVTEVLRA